MVDIIERLEYDFAQVEPFLDGGTMNEGLTYCNHCGCMMRSGDSECFYGHKVGAQEPQVVEINLDPPPDDDNTVITIG